ncbi:MAG: hypothetical protein MI923_05235 [Phycisphaerales bacterium]|nr:hypothetical protein [Phycisphaerales bacterium]
MKPRVILSTCLTCITVMTVGCGLVGGDVIGGTFSDTGNDTANRFFHRASLLQNGQVMVSGGMRINLIPATLVSLSDLSFFDPVANSFSASFQPTGGGPMVTPSLSVARSSHTQTTLQDGRVLITGGRTNATGTNPGTPINSVEIFDPLTGTIQAGPAMSTQRTDHTASLLPDGRVVVAGGGTWQIFDPTTDTWSVSFALQRTRAAHAAVALPDHDGPGLHRVLLIAGNGNGSTTLELLNPDATMSTLLSATLTIGVDDLAATLLNDGTVLIVAGQHITNGDTVDLSYRYDPVTDIITPTAPPPGLANGISDHQIVALDRFAIIFGGEQQVSGVDTELDYAAVYDGATGDWPFVTTMNHPHDDFAAVLLPDDRILLIDGGVPFLNMAFPSNAVEIFTPTLIKLGDMNNDTILNELDVLPFVGVLIDPDTASSLERCAADTNGDHSLDARDIQMFVNALISGLP